MRYFYVGAMGEVGSEALRKVCERVSGALDCPVRDLRLPGPDFAYDAGRRQYGSIPVLEMLLRECPADALKLLAVTESDLFIPVLTFVYGHAQLGGRVAVVSMARLRQEFYGLPPQDEVFLDRAGKEALHEAGHMFGLVHCADKRCAMSLSTNIRQIDAKDPDFCETCANQLRRNTRESI